MNTSAFKLRSFKELLHFSPRIVERVWGWFGGVSVGRSGWRSVGGWMLYSVYSCILCFQTYSLGTMWRFFFLNSDSGRVACRNNRSACPQKFNGFGWFPEIYLGLSLFIWLMSICWYLLNIWDYSLGTLFLATWIHLIFAEAFAFAARCQRWISEKFN